MKNILLALSLVLTITGCSDKRESDIDSRFRPGHNPGQSLQALPSNQTTNINTPFNTNVPFVITQSTPALTFSVLNQPVHGTVAINANTGAYVYTPHNNYSGPDLFTWQVDQGSQSATASVNITVLPANSPPVAHNQVLTTPEDTPINGN